MKTSYFCLLAALVSFSLCDCSVAAANGTALYTNGTLKYPSEETGLLAFKTALEDPRNVMANWNVSIQPDLCLWNGIICNVNGSVIYLFFVKELLAGPISPSLSNLTRLRTLDLRQNSLTGTIPPELAALPSLTSVKLSYNKLEGTIPSEFGRSTLRTLALHYNRLSGSLPDALWNCTGLRQLTIYANNLTGTISPSIGNLTNLWTLRLSDNNFYGEIPSSIGNITGLIFIGLAGNSFNGTIPSTICQQKTVNNILLNGNNLSGSFPPELLRCTQLVNLTLDNNKLSGSIPEGFFNLLILQTLTLSNNNFSGSLPTDLSNARSLNYFDIHSNNFSGTLPDFSEVKNLTYVDLSGNPLLGGLFPTSLLSSASTLNTLYVNDSHLEGPLPSSIVNFTSLSQFNFSGNYFNGTVPSSVQTYLENRNMSTTSWLSLVSGNCLRGDPDANCSNFYNRICYLSNQRPPTDCFMDPLLSEKSEKHTLGTALILSVVGATVLLALLIGSGMLLVPFKKKETVRMQVKSVNVTRGGPIVSMRVTKGGNGEGKEVMETDKDGVVDIGNSGIATSASALVVTKKALTETKERDIGFPKPVMSVSPKGGNVKKLSLEQLRIATDNFSMKLGSGSLGDTFQGTLGNGKVVAVKMLKNTNQSTLSSAAFVEEVESIHKLQNPHLVGLLAYCQEGSVRAFVNQYVSNSSLYDHLHEGRPKLTWNERMRIALGVSLGIDYLHSAQPQACHGDIKSSNVLLTDDLSAKVVDFSFDKEKLLGHSANPLSSHTNLRGAFGYVDPDNLEGLKMSEKSDVYSFGVLLFELVTGRKALQEDSMTLVVWVQDYLVTRDRLPQMVDPEIRSTVPVTELEAVVAVAQACTRTTKSKRPTMNEVKNALVERLKISPAMAAPQNKGLGDSFDSDDLLSNASIASSGYDEMR